MKELETIEKLSRKIAASMELKNMMIVDLNKKNEWLEAEVKQQKEVIRQLKALVAGMEKGGKL
jgi:hypothetical protein